MQANVRRLTASALALALVLGASVLAQSRSSSDVERFSAVAIVNNEFGADAGRVNIRIERWSTDAERDQLVNTLREHGPDALVEHLRKAKRAGNIYTPDSIGYDLHYAHQTIDEEGNRQIVIATDRPIAFWELHLRSRTIEYPFTVVQMEISRDGTGKGTLSPMTKITIEGDNLVLENFATAPVMLTRISSDEDGN